MAGIRDRRSSFSEGAMKALDLSSAGFVSFSSLQEMPMIRANRTDANLAMYDSDASAASRPHSARRSSSLMGR